MSLTSPGSPATGRRNGSRVERHAVDSRALLVDDAASGGIVPNGSGIVTGFPQILSDAPTVKAALRRRIRASRRLRGAAERAEVARRPRRRRPRTATDPGRPVRGPLRLDRHRAPDRTTAPGPTQRRHRTRCCRWCAGATSSGPGTPGTTSAPAPAPAVASRAGAPSARADRSGADVVLVPALAVDTLGTRLGQGGGYYDSALPLARPGRSDPRGRPRRRGAGRGRRGAARRAARRAGRRRAHAAALPAPSRPGLSRPPPHVTAWAPGLIVSVRADSRSTAGRGERPVEGLAGGPRVDLVVVVRVPRMARLAGLVHPRRAVERGQVHDHPHARARGHVEGSGGRVVRVRVDDRRAAGQLDRSAVQQGMQQLRSGRSRPAAARRATAGAAGPTARCPGPCPARWSGAARAETRASAQDLVPALDHPRRPGGSSHHCVSAGP